MNHRNPRSAVRLGMLPAGIAIALAPAFAGAQEQAEQGATTLDRIEVTGSRIRGADMETQQPIITIGREQLQQQGFVSIADVLQNLTSAGSPAIARSEVLASGENVGGYYVDLRNLGAQRTLVLVNGKRLGATTGGLQDLSQIPMSAISRIEILKDGASAIYGSDAIAGVVNVITRKRFEGAEANAYFGQYGEGDGDKQTYDFTVGAVGDRGGVTASVEYSKEDPVWAKDRWYSASGNAGPKYPGSGWSAVSQNGSFLGPCGPNGANAWCTYDGSGDPTNIANFRPHVASDNANSNEQMMAQTAIERRSVFVNANYDIVDNVTFNADMLYNHRSTLQQVAGYPYQSGAFGTPLSADSAFNPTNADVAFRRRLWEVPRTTNSELETYRFAGGFNGFFEMGGRSFDWDVGAMMNRNNLTKFGHGDMSLLASPGALGPSFINANGVAQCGTAANPIPLGTNLGSGECMPWNPLLPYGVDGQGSLSNPTLQAFLFPYYADTGRTKTTSYTANLAGSLFDLPAGELGFAVGVEHRKEDGRFVPDAFNQSGMSTGLPATTTQGGYSLDEVYLELNIPVLSDLPFAKELTFNIASRYSDYSNFGDTTNSKFGFTWRPLDELLVRGTYAEGFRAPTIDNLYGGVGGSFEYYTDPCGSTSSGNVAGNAACTSAGVSPTYVQLGQGGANCTSFPCQTGYQFLTGSNPNLTPETAESQTMGIVWSPRWVQGLDFTLDWYKVTIENVISDDSVDDILGDCYRLGISARCEGIVRDSTGAITFMQYGLTNKGAVETEGYDFGAKYRLPETAFGKFTFDWQNSYVSYYRIKADDAPDTSWTNYTGRGPNFRLRSNLGVNWEMGAFAANWTTRYYSGMSEACTRTAECTDLLYSSPDTNLPGKVYPLREVGSNAFHDLQVSWKAPWNATIAVGANNVTDHKGPIMFSAPNSQYPYYGGFDIGRFYYLKYQQRF
ncbi:TonB-dependent receptor plug domain-containing protein [Aerolutibacter ruishenii]|uniref:Iron complex outermembrane receptor protein n=1 Tax=Aerolutibacter ruishenii TaxID=686800 RepID=A0A562LRX4_9GAMM|nr:TonB-dependent receptor [Lysobacter ruishenii]TWI10380.1 iron complex outermembrane receptor protein [Lysobacter ruishenii]